MKTKSSRYKKVNLIVKIIKLQYLFNSFQEEQSNNLVSKIHRVLAPFMLRRLKADVLQLNVPKKEVTVYCPMSPLQMRLYEMVIDQNIAGITLSHI